jgi:hypothetical protein
MVEPHRQLAERSPGADRDPLTGCDGVNERHSIAADPFATAATSHPRRMVDAFKDDQPASTQSASSGSICLTRSGIGVE